MAVFLSALYRMHDNRAISRTFFGSFLHRICKERPWQTFVLTPVLQSMTCKMPFTAKKAGTLHFCKVSTFLQFNPLTRDFQPHSSNIPPALRGRVTHIRYKCPSSAFPIYFKASATSPRISSTFSILSDRQALLPQKRSPFSTSPSTARISASVIQ